MTLDLRASLESLHGQRAVLDQALEKAGSLSLHMKQAESVIEQLRRSGRWRIASARQWWRCGRRTSSRLLAL
jgi:hypothetical protein